MGVSAANRGMGLEESLIQSSRTYRARGLAAIVKVPSPIRVKYGRYADDGRGRRRWSLGEAFPDAHADKSADFLGTWQSHGFALEAKETHLDYLPLKNFKKDGIRFLRDQEVARGIALVAVMVIPDQSVYLMPFGVVDRA